MIKKQSLIQKTLREKEKQYGKNIFEKNNKVWIRGKIIQSLRFSHEKQEEKFYWIILEILSLSGKKNYIKVIIPQKLLNIESLEEGKMIEVGGKLRSRYVKENVGVSTLEMFVIATIVNEIEYTEEPLNCVYIEGNLCNNSFDRITPKGKKINSFVIETKRCSGPSDFFRCIVWGMFSSITKNSKIRIYGRMQNLKNSNLKTNCEISAFHINLIKD